jgi:putative acetyltransferase
MLIIRQENPEDISAVCHVNKQAFGGPHEAALGDALRKAARAFVSLVSVKNDQFVGHISFSPAMIEGGPVGSAMRLAPTAVLPECQQRGIGSQLLRAGQEDCRRLGCEIVVVLRHPEYCPRFGFIPAHKKGWRCEYEVAEGAFMVAELKAGALNRMNELVKYHEAFSSI